MGALDRAGWPRSISSKATAITIADLFTAMDTAVTKLGASVVSMSFGADFEVRRRRLARASRSIRPTSSPALAANPNVTFLASTGDSGADSGDAPNYPSVSPLVVAVGGTTLNLAQDRPVAERNRLELRQRSKAGLECRRRRHQHVLPEPAFQDNDGFNSSGFPHRARRLLGRRSQHRASGLRSIRFRSSHALGDDRRDESFIADAGRA